MTAAEQELDAIRSKPIVQLTPDEIGCLTEQEQRWVFGALALFDARDKAATR